MKYYKTIQINGKQKRLHRYIMECFLNRELGKDEIVHHKNGDILDNRLENLEIIKREDHIKIHNIKHNGKYNLDEKKLNELYETKTIKEIADIYDCSKGAIQRLLKLKKKKIIYCIKCHNVAIYKNKKLCNKCYMKEYHKKNEL